MSLKIGLNDGNDMGSASLQGLSGRFLMLLLEYYSTTGVLRVLLVLRSSTPVLRSGVLLGSTLWPVNTFFENRWSYDRPIQRQRHHGHSQPHTVYDTTATTTTILGRVGTDCERVISHFNVVDCIPRTLTDRNLFWFTSVLTFVSRPRSINPLEFRWGNLTFKFLNDRTLPARSPRRQHQHQHQQQQQDEPILKIWRRLMYQNRAIEYIR